MSREKLGAFFNNKNLKIIGVLIAFLLLSYLELILPYKCEKEIFYELRLPRYLGIIISGFSISSAGFLLQYITRNPLADPFIIGTSGGVMISVILSKIFLISSYSFFYLFMNSFFGVAATFFAFKIASISQRVISNILLSGFAINSIVFSIIVFLIIFSKENSLYFLNISFGSFSYLDYKIIFYSFLFLFVVLFFIRFLFKYIISISFDDEKSITLGIDVKKIRFLVFIISSVLTSLSVSLSGMIGFVGLMIPHITRYFFSEFSFKIIFFLNGFLAIIFLLIADVFSRYFFYPVEFPPGIFSSIFGSLFFIYLVIKSRKKIYEYY
jgi:iron complex transport system permease protein